MKLGIVGLPECRKSHPLQRHHQRRRGERQLPLLHHRPQCGRGGGAGTARLDELAEIYERAGQKHPGRHRVRGHRRPGQGRQPEAPGLATSSWPTSGRRTPSSMWSAALTMKHRRIVAADAGDQSCRRTLWGTLRPSTWNSSSRTWTCSTAGSTRPRRPPRPTRSTSTRWTLLQGPGGAHLDAGGNPPAPFQTAQR